MELELVPLSELPEWNEEDEKGRLEFEAKKKAGTLFLRKALTPKIISAVCVPYGQ